MLGKLLSFLAQAKGAAIATVVVAGAATATVGATSPEVQQTFSDISAAVTGSSPAPHTTSVSDEQSDTRCAAGEDADNGGGQPVIVAQRNAAEKLLRDAYNDDHKQLEDLRGGGGQDNKAVGDVVRTYDDQLRDTLNIALNRVAALTLGRDGQVRKAEASASARASASGSGRPSESPRPSATATVKPSGSAAAASASAKPSCSPKPSASAHPSGSAKPSEQGRVAVADRTTLDPDVKAIVDQAITDMAALVKKAVAEAAALPSPDHGKPSNDHGNKPESSDKPGNGDGGGNGNGNRPSASASPRR